MKAAGVNNNTKAQLKKLMAEGYDAEEISHMIQVEEVSVKAWMNYFADKVKVEKKEENKPEKKSIKDKILGK